MTIVIRSANRTFLSPSPLSSIDKYLHAAANIISFNPLIAPAFEVRGGALELQLHERVTYAVTGDATVLADGEQAETWRAGVAQRSLEVKATGTAYVSIKGLQVSSVEPAQVRPGLSLAAVNPDSVPPKVLQAVKIPAGLKYPQNDWLESVSRLQRHVALVADAVQRGAELVKVKVGGSEYEVWVLELE
ncbi:hypothetical protein [Thermofilum pendens]|uniref:Carboxyltransferase domain-containing protein n=1 Tax=Thermofilum pendens (strain DSM 2475 / Hrk 5) TaxID=368408 RepID=A1RWI7_THEPD|nr:hypothetical protein [Thermofilum pendens]ABL77567.1 hypothetical protein Tpen_0157 [Thermofilum pendens Hrk 5]